METKTARKIVKPQETLLLDEQYRCFHEEYRIQNTRFTQVMQELPADKLEFEIRYLS